MGMTNEKRVIHLSRGQGQEDINCPRARFWGTVYGGTGIEPTEESIDLAFGEIVHRNTEDYRNPKEAAARAGEEMREWCVEHMIADPQKTEWPILAEALVYAYLSRTFANLLEEYDVESIEEDVVYTDDEGYRWPTRPDRLLRRKSDGTLWYYELKTTSLDSATFSRIWSLKTQPHFGGLAVQQSTGKEVEGVVVQGFQKGSKYKGQLRSRLVGGYRREGAPGVTKTTYRLSHGKGFEWFLASEYPGGVQAWVDQQVPWEIIAETFPITPPIVPDPKLVRRFTKQRQGREKEIKTARMQIENAQSVEEVEGILDRYFPQNIEQCENPITRRQCPFYRACHNPVVEADPVGSGLYRERVPYRGQREEPEK